MKRGNVTLSNGSIYKNMILIETNEELEDYIKKSTNSNIILVKKDWRKIINVENQTLVIYPANGVSYFCVPKKTKIEYL
jgi:phage pi2 protein 07